MMMTVVKLEWLRLRRSPVATLILLFALLASFYAVWSGARWADGYQKSLEAYEAHISERMATWRSQLEAIEAGTAEPSPYDARPMDIRIAGTHGLGDLGHLAVGYRDITPARLNISAWRNDISMVERYEFDNPTILSFGTFDFAFFLVVVMPVLMIALSFDVIASDRSSGRARLLLSNPVSEAGVILSRLLVRNGLLAAVMLLALLWGFVEAPALSGANALLWSAICLGYMAFWLGLIFLVVARVRRSEGAAAGLVGAWVMIVFALPALVDTAVEGLYPPPSKLAYLSVARLAEGEATKRTAELTEGFLADHPDLSVGDTNVPGYYRRVFLANEQVRENTAPITAAFRQTADARERTVGLLQYLSPSVVAQRALYTAAESDMASSRRFLEAGGVKLQALSGDVRSAVISRNRIPLAQYDAIEPLRLDQHSIRSEMLASLFCLCLLAAAGVLAARRLAAGSQPGEN